VLAQQSPKKIADSLKRSAEQSRRRKGSAFQSAMSMLTFYLNRAGRALPRVAQAEARKGQGRAAQGLPPRAHGFLTAPFSQRSV
jgi:hypothetical protein